MKITAWRNNSGFTLIELLVAISIISILSVVGFVSYQNVTSKAKDTKVKADIDAIKKAYETNYDPSLNSGQGGYKPLSDTNFAQGKIPTPPQGGTYFNVTDTNRIGFKICAALSGNSSSVCNTSAVNCYCQTSDQGTIPSGSALLGDNSGLGLGGSGSAPSCDPNGTLLSGLVGYWKMDEGSWNGTTGEVLDSSGNNNNGGRAGVANTVLDQHTGFGGVAKLNNIASDYLRIPVSNTSLLNIGSSDFTISTWLNIAQPSCRVDRPTYCGGGLLGNYPHDDNQTGELFIGISDDRASLVLGHRYASGQFATYSYNYTPFYNEWAHVVWVKNSSTLSLYIDGGDAKRVWNISTIPFNVKFQASGNANYFVGSADWVPGVWSSVMIDDHRIYNVALSKEEVGNLYNDDKGCL